MIIYRTNGYCTLYIFLSKIYIPEIKKINVCHLVVYKTWYLCIVHIGKCESFSFNWAHLMATRMSEKVPSMCGPTPINRGLWRSLYVALKLNNWDSKLFSSVLLSPRLPSVHYNYTLCLNLLVSIYS